MVLVSVHLDKLFIYSFIYLSIYLFTQIKVGKKTKAGYGLRQARVIRRKYPIPNGQTERITQEEVFDILFACNEKVTRKKKRVMSEPVTRKEEPVMPEPDQPDG